MGGGNAQKTAMARAKKLEKAAKGSAGSQLKSNAAANNIVCQICRSTFICTSTVVKLKEHADNKHPKNKFEECFPGHEA
ncbi:hypothetical protein H632_c983p0 [Helicosporidium sp. ATCC 50920]|nr:hypothetical protein H632_c983p0 [Helicosporidium sp. ATCC 50920]|eukprot:KDD74926.1 hypothetical protein H632_c983p0 [Helicosporidium sp. ATCC 50920]